MAQLVRLKDEGVAPLEPDGLLVEDAKLPSVQRYNDGEDVPPVRIPMPWLILRLWESRNEAEPDGAAVPPLHADLHALAVDVR